MDLYFLLLLQECRVFNDSNVVTNHPRRCCQLITKLLHILTQGETFTSSEVCAWVRVWLIIWVKSHGVISASCDVGWLIESPSSAATTGGHREHCKDMMWTTTLRDPWCVCYVHLVDSTCGHRVFHSLAIDEQVTDVFFGVTKLFQSKDHNLRRMM